MQLCEPSATRPTCYVCENPAGGYRTYVNDDYAIIKCAECGLEYTYPIPTEATLKQFYAQYHDMRADPRIVELNAIEHLRMLGKYGWTAESRTLDVGAGAGVFVQVAGDNCYGVEWRPISIPRIKQTLDEFGNVVWDVITLWGVLEHLAHPKQVIGRLVSRLRCGGILALTTVDTEGVIPYYYKPPEHLTYWTRAAFDVLSSDCGLEIVEYEPYRMFQLGHIYVQRLLSRTPEEYRQHISNNLTEVVCVPTNEVRVVMRRVGNSHEQGRVS